MARLAFGTRQPVAKGLIALLLILFLLFVSGPKLVAPPKVDQGHPFNTQATLDRLARILGDETPHPVDSDASDAVIARLLSEIEALGFTPRVDDAFHCAQGWSVTCAQLRNIGFWVTDPGPDAVMIASHHDSVPTGPGAADDGMGVSSSLEIARIMKAQHIETPLRRPLYVLITDAEEVGLIGAAHFVQNDPVAPMIGAVVSLEARGNRGIANMFETSDPNGRDLAALTRFPGTKIKSATSNSLAVDIYRAMPNGTDVTEYLKLGLDAANYAVVGRPSHYHTIKDNLANLDPNAVFHIGASALSAANGFMNVDASTPDTPTLYSDILGLFVVALPQVLALPLMGLGALCCAVAVGRLKRSIPLWRVLVWPLAVLIAGTVTAWLTGWIIDVLRPEVAFGTAYPAALRGLFLASALGVGAAVSRALYEPEDADSYLAGLWAVMLTLGVLASFAMPGAALLFMLPAVFVVPGAVLLILRKTFAAHIFFALAALTLLCILIPMNALAETALFVETSAPLSAGVLWIFLAALPLFWRNARRVRPALIGAGLVTIGLGVAAIFVPAYSEDAPLGLNIQHLDSDRMEQPVFSIGARHPVPDSMAAVAPFAETSVPAFSRRPVMATPAPATPFSQATLTRLSETVSGDKRTLRLQIDAPDADRVQIFADGDDPKITGLTINDQRIISDPATLPFMSCVGRRCRNVTVDITLARDIETLELTLTALRYGLDETAQALTDARPNWAGPQHQGDSRRVRSHISLPLGRE
jgi:hypothetical protein